MVDKVDGPGIGQVRRPDSSGVRTSAGSGADGDRNAVDAVSANQFNSADVSSQSVYSQLKAEIATTSEVDKQQVERIKAAISRGEFSIDAEKVAQAVYQLEQLLSNEV